MWTSLQHANRINALDKSPEVETLGIIWVGFARPEFPSLERVWVTTAHPGFGAKTVLYYDK